MPGVLGCPGQGPAVAATPPLPLSYPDFRGGRPYIHDMATNNGQVTPRTLTDAMIREALDALPPNHYSRQWYLDALGSEHHPMRRANARREVCAALNDHRSKEAP